MSLFESANLVRAPRCLSKHSHSYGEICCICILKVWDDANFNVGHGNWINHGLRPGRPPITRRRAKSMKEQSKRGISVWLSGGKKSNPPMEEQLQRQLSRVPIGTTSPIRLLACLRLQMVQDHGLDLNIPLEVQPAILCI